MDGSFLSDENVVAASREFVCIRLATYEDEAETEFLTSVFSGRDGELQNTVFAVLAPNGKKFLTRTGRGPHFAFRDAADMAEFMRKTVKAYETVANNDKPLPVMKSVDVAMNVAACDGLQLVVRVREDGSQVTEFDHQLASAAWSEKFAGQFVFAEGSPAELEGIAGVKVKAGVVIAEPDGFGISGLAIQQVAEKGATAKSIESTLSKALRARVPVMKNIQQHIRAGTQMGIDWETEVPVTDQQSLDAKSRYRGDN